MMGFALAATVGVVAVVSLLLGPVPDILEYAKTAVLVCVAGALVHGTVPVMRLNRLSLPSVWFFSHVGLLVVGGHLVAADFADTESAGRFITAVRVGLITTALGIWIGGKLLGVKPSGVERYFRSPVLYDQLGRYFLLLYGAAVAGALLLTANYVRETPVIPLVAMIRNPGEYVFLTLAREESFKLLDSPFRYAYTLLRVLGFPLLIGIALGLYRHARTWSWLAVFVAVLGAGLFLAGASTAKFPVATVVLLLFAYYYLDRNGRIGTTAIVGMVLLFLAFPILVVLGLSAQTGFNLMPALQNIALRIFYDPALTVYYYFDVIPSHLEFLGGQTIGKLSSLLGTPFFDVENFVSIVREESSITTGTANAAYIANLYADWGFVGVALGGTVTGVLLSAGQSLVHRLRRTPVAMAMYAHLMLTALLLMITSLPTVLMTNGALFVLAAPVVFGFGNAFLETVADHAPHPTTAS